MSNLILALTTLLLSATPVSLASSNPPKTLGIAAVVQRIAPQLPPSEAKAIAQGVALVKHSTDCQTDWKVLLAIAYIESGFNRYAINKKTNDIGLMQVNAHTAKTLQLSTRRLLKDLPYNIQAGCKVIDENRMNFATRYSYWLGFYRAGVKVANPGTVRNAMQYSKIINNKVKEIHTLEKGESTYVH